MYVARSVGQQPVLHFINIGGIGPEQAAVQCLGHRCFVHHRATPNVHQDEAVPGQAQCGSVDQMARGAQEGNGQKNVVRAGQRLRQRHDGQSLTLAMRIHAQHLRTTESLQAVHDGAAHSAQPHHRHHRSLQTRSVKTWSPSGVMASHRLVARQQMPPRSDRQAHGQFSGGCGQQIGNKTHADTRLRTGFEVKVVKPLECTGDGFELRGVLQRGRVHAVGHEGHQGLCITQVKLQFSLAPRLGPRIHHHLAAGLKFLQHLGGYRLGHHDLGHVDELPHLRR